MNDEEAVGVISNLVRVQAVVGTGAAVREGEDHHAMPTLLRTQAKVHAKQHSDMWSYCSEKGHQSCPCKRSPKLFVPHWTWPRHPIEVQE